MSPRLGELLVRAGLLTQEQLEWALNQQRTSGGKLGSNLVRMGVLKEGDLVNFLSKQYGVPAINLAEVPPDPTLKKLLPLDMVEKYHSVPVKKEGTTLLLAVSDPSNHFAVEDIRFHTGLNVKIAVAAEGAIKAAIDAYYDDYAQVDSLMSDIGQELELVQEETDVNVVELKKASDEAPVVKLVNFVLTNAVKKGASDIHMEPYERELRIRYRIDGVLHEEMKPPLKLKGALASRVKIMSQLDIAERRLPQDGRIKLKLGQGREIDFRVSVLPTLYGEKIVLRLLDKSSLQLDMTKLGFEARALKDFKEAIYRPYGMVLVTGPTGSGKTTTLYSALTELNKVTDNISTAEDPVEYNLAGINQVQMHEAIGLTFSGSLRAFLRQDPDIIMVGEIRDLETAEIGVKAALTGHLVLSTLHTNDAPSTIDRLINMGVEPFLVASAVNLIMAQRLVRKICADCKEPLEVPPEALIDIGANPEEVGQYQCSRGAGCSHCNFTGYKGRIALYEVMPLHPELKDLILRGATSSEIKAEAIRLGMKSLRLSGVTKIKEGVTTVDEVVRVTVPD